MISEKKIYNIAGLSGLRQLLMLRFLLMMAALSMVVNVTSLKPSSHGILVIRSKLACVNREIETTMCRMVSRTKELRMSETDTSPEKSKTNFDLEAWFNPNTRGGVIVWSIILAILPIVLNNKLVESGMDADEVGVYVGFAFVCVSMLGWASTYLLRVASKDMTYATQLREYENAVLKKRLEELADDEIRALLEEIEDEDL